MGIDTFKYADICMKSLAFRVYSCRNRFSATSISLRTLLQALKSF